MHRLSRALTAVVLTIWLLSTAMVAWYVNHQIQENFDVELVESAYRQLYPSLLEVQIGYPQDSLATALNAARLAKDPLVMGLLPGSDHSEPLLLQLRSNTLSLIHI